MRLWKKRGVYYVEISRGQSRSLHTRDGQEAKRLFAVIKKEALKGRLAEISGEVTKTLGEFVEEYEAWARDAIESKSTLRANLLALSKLLRHAGGTCRLDRVSQKHTDSLIAESRRAGLAAASINNYLRHARAVLGKAVEWGYLKSNPLSRVRELPVQARPAPHIQPADVIPFLATIQDLDERRLVTAFIYSGRRRSELLRLRWEHVSMEREEYLVEQSKTHLSKVFPMHPLFKAVLASIGPQGSGRIFSRWEHPDTLSHIVKACLEHAGYGHLHLHEMRHTFATLLIEEGQTLKDVQELLGHSDYRATLRYAHMTNTRMRSAIRAIKGGPVDLKG